MVEKSKPEYIKLKNPADVLAYVQRLVNSLRIKGLELEPEYIGKIIYLLNTWLAAYKLNLENVEMQQLREELEEIRAIIKVEKGHELFIRREAD